MDAAALVGLMEGGLDAQLHVPAQFLGRPTEGGGLTEDDALVVDAGNGRACRGGGRRLLDGGALGLRGVATVSVTTGRGGGGEGANDERGSGESYGSTDPQLGQHGGRRQGSHVIPPSATLG